MVRHKNVITKGSARYAFVCSVYEQNRGKKGCTKKYVREQDIQEAVLQSLCLQIEMVLDGERLLRQLQKQGGTLWQKEALEDKISSVQQQMKRNAALRSTLYESLCDGTLTKAEYLSLKEEYDQRAQELERELAEFQKEEQDYKSRLSSWEEWLVSLKGYCGFMEGKTGIPNGCRRKGGITREFALELIQSIRVSGYNELEIVWSFRDEFTCIAEGAAYAEGCGTGIRKGAH
ncbi:MAG: hypothetical protein K2H45_13710, partial [Acetatifactor sp.]|nr:hypothetical protein [Acetatifactor sp.]